MSRYLKINIKVPDVNRSYVSGNYKYSAPETISANKELLAEIYKTRGNFVHKWGTEFEIDDAIICCFIAAESANKNLPPNKFEATGLMQMTPDTVWEILVKWETRVGSKMSRPAMSYFQSVLPLSKKYDPNVLPTSSVKKEILDALKNNIEFNIAIGVANLRWLLQALAENGVAHLNKATIAYNAGFYATRNKLKGKMTTEQMVANKSFPLESRAYLLKLFGVNGYLQLWFDKK